MVGEAKLPLNADVSVPRLLAEIICYNEQLESIIFVSRSYFIGYETVDLHSLFQLCRNPAQQATTS